MAQIVVHHLTESRSSRVLWLLEELGLDYEMKTYQRNRRTMRAPPELREVHPLGKSPVVEIDGRTFAETGAVVDAVLDRADGELRPPRDTAAFEHYRFFLHYGEGSMMPPLLVSLITGRLRTAPLPFFVKPLVRRIADQVDASFTDGELELHGRFVEDHLAARPYFTGDAFTAADVVMSYPVDAGFARGMFGDEHPRARAWLDEMKARPAYQRAIERGGVPVPG